MTSKTVGVVLLSHGIVSFGAEARESYERMIELVSMAEEYLQKKKAWHLPLSAGSKTSVKREEIASLRRAISEQAGFPVVLKTNDSEKFRAFARRPDVGKISQHGPATPDHLLFTKPTPMIGRDVAEYARRYEAYFNRNAKQANEPKTMLDAAPRMVLDPQLGFAAAGPSRSESSGSGRLR